MLKKPNLQLDIEDAYWYAFATTRDYEDFTATILDTYFNIFFCIFVLFVRQHMQVCKLFTANLKHNVLHLIKKLNAPMGEK